jgi:hypothetical protein
MRVNIYLNTRIHVRFSQKEKTPIVNRVGEDREVAVGTTYVGEARAVTILGRLCWNKRGYDMTQLSFDDNKDINIQ